MGERYSPFGRNVRPVATAPLPVTNFAEDEPRADYCGECDGGGEQAVDCEACKGDGCDDEGNPCKVCNAVGFTWVTCWECDGTGRAMEHEEA